MEMSKLATEAKSYIKNKQKPPPEIIQDSSQQSGLKKNYRFQSNGFSYD